MSAYCCFVTSRTLKIYPSKAGGCADQYQLLQRRNFEGFQSSRPKVCTNQYCCFVTISTIGFGDVVPGSSNFDTAVGQLKMVVAAVYMVFGMALLSMSFNLIQEEMGGNNNLKPSTWCGGKLVTLDLHSCSTPGTVTTWMGDY